MFNPNDFDLQCIVGDVARREYIENGPDNWVSVGKAILLTLHHHLLDRSDDEGDKE